MNGCFWCCLMCCRWLNNAWLCYWSCITDENDRKCIFWSNFSIIWQVFCHFQYVQDILVALSGVWCAAGPIKTAGNSWSTLLSLKMLKIPLFCCYFEVLCYFLARSGVFKRFSTSWPLMVGLGIVWCVVGRSNTPGGGLGPLFLRTIVENAVEASFSLEMLKLWVFHQYLNISGMFNHFWDIWTQLWLLCVVFRVEKTFILHNKDEN